MLSFRHSSRKPYPQAFEKTGMLEYEADPDINLEKSHKTRLLVIMSGPAGRNSVIRHAMELNDNCDLNFHHIQEAARGAASIIFRTGAV